MTKKENDKDKNLKQSLKKSDKVIKKDDKIENKKEEVINENFELSKTSSLFEKIVILIAIALVFSLLGYFIGKNNNVKKNYLMASKDLQVFIEQYNKIVDEYYKDVDKETLIKGAIKGMLSTLDDYSEVIDDSSNNFSITLEGTYEGLGVEVINDSDGNIIVYNVYDDSPAQKSGIKVADIITKVNDKNLKNVSTKEFVSMINEFSNIKLTLLRDDKELQVETKKEKITLRSVYYEMLENDIGYIKVSLFANNTQDQFKEALEKLEKDNMKGLIIDLRDNTGGHLKTVRDMLSLFLDSSHIIYQTETKTETLNFYSKGNTDKKYKIVILQNESSASASEIMSSALKEQLNAYIIGKKSYGKGTVQQLESTELGQYKFTTKKWLTSKGKWLDGIGQEVDLDISLPSDYYNNPTRENDTQFTEAIKYLN